MQALGVKALRVELSWDDVAPASDERHQAQLRRDQPGQLQLGRTTTRSSMKRSRSRWKVLLTVTSPVPRWATSNKKAPYVTARPTATSKNS